MASSRSWSVSAFLLLFPAALCGLLVIDAPVASGAQVDGVIRCDACKFLVKLVQDIEEGNVTLAVGKDIATTYCEVNHGGLGYVCTGTWQCKDVCSGAVDEFAPIVLEVGF